MVSWFNNLKLQTRLLLLFSALTLLAAVVAGWFIYTILQYDREIERVVLEANGLAEIGEVQAFLLEEQIALAEYRLSGSEEHLVAYNEAEEQADHYLRQAIADAESPEARDTVSLINEEKEAYNRAVDEVLGLHEAGNAEEAVRTAQEIAGAEAERVERINELIEGFVYKEQLKLADAVREADQRAGLAIGVAVATLLALSGLTIIAALVTNQVAEPILHMTNAVVAFENDAFEPQLLESYLKRREEMGQLARAFTSMVDSISTMSQLKDDLLNAAGRFVPVAYLDFLEKDNITAIRLGDHVSAEMAVMFSDIRSFTTISEGMTPQQNFDFVNNYLKRVSPTIQNHNGFVVKFLGDGMMAIFPYDVEEALKAGIEKIAVVNQFNSERAGNNEAPIDLGIGIHTGHMMVGMIGEEGRMQGDAFSDNVNLTARIEGLNKFFGTSLIISAETLARLEDPGRYNMRLLGQVQVKGREKPITLYEVFDADPEDLKQRKLQVLDTFHEALRLYTMGALDQARPLFENVLRGFPQDKTSALYIDQIAYYKEHGKPEFWDSIITMTSK